MSKGIKIDPKSVESSKSFVNEESKDTIIVELGKMLVSSLILFGRCYRIESEATSNLRRKCFKNKIGWSL